MDKFADQISARRDHELLINFRSSKPVVKHAERLFRRDPPMIAGGEAAVFSEKPRHVHTATTVEAVTEHFIPALDDLGIDYGEAAILAPSWFKLLPLGHQLRKHGIPITGPGARPYKRRHLFGAIAEQICAYIEHPEPSRVPCIERELFGLLTHITGSANFSVYTYSGRRTVFRLIRLGRRLRQQHEEALAWLRAAAREVTAVLCEEEFLPPSCSHLLIESVTDIERDMAERRNDIADLTVADLGLFASYIRNMKLLTMHRAKGREFDAVAITDLNDGQVPYYTRCSPLTPEKIEEGRRLLYVAVTRARRLLMYITDDENWRKPSRFLFEGQLGCIPGQLLA